MLKLIPVKLSHSAFQQRAQLNQKYILSLQSLSLLRPYLREAGRLDMHSHGGNQTALELVVNFADWLNHWMAPISPEQWPADFGGFS